MIKHYVEFLHPGIIISDSSEKEVSHRDYSKIKIPENAFGFRFFDIETVVVKGEKLIGKKKNLSKWYYQGEIYTKKDVENKVKDNDIILRNMEYNSIEKVIKTKFGQYIPMEKGDCVI